MCTFHSVIGPTQFVFSTNLSLVTCNLGALLDQSDIHIYTRGIIPVFLGQELKKVFETDDEKSHIS